MDHLTVNCWKMLRKMTQLVQVYNYKKRNHVVETQESKS